MATPCEKLGCKVGDKFKVVCEESRACGFKKGATITLYKDGRSDCPLFAGANAEFSLADGEGGAYLNLAKVEPLKAKRPWIKWEGGECPVPEGTRVDVKYRSEGGHKGVKAGVKYAEDWTHTNDPRDIIAYRLAKPKKAAEPVQAEPAQEVQPEPTVQREDNGRPVGAKVGDWFRVIEESGGRPYKVGDVVQFGEDDGSCCPYFLLNGKKTCIYWFKLESCPDPSQPEPEPAKPEWEILWGSVEDFEGAPDWAVYVLGEGTFAEDVIRGSRLMYSKTGAEDVAKGLAHTTPKAARRLKQPK